MKNMVFLSILLFALSGCCSSPKPKPIQTTILLPEPPLPAKPTGSLRVKFVRSADGKTFTIKPVVESDINLKAIENWLPGGKEFAIISFKDLVGVSREVKEWRMTWAETEKMAKVLRDNKNK